MPVRSWPEGRGTQAEEPGSKPSKARSPHPLAFLLSSDLLAYLFKGLCPPPLPSTWGALEAPSEQAAGQPVQLRWVPVSRACSCDELPCPALGTALGQKEGLTPG